MISILGFPIGTWVRLRSGGPRMLVLSKRIDGARRFYTCDWLGEAGQNRGEFEEPTIDALDPQPAAPP